MDESIKWHQWGAEAFQKAKDEQKLALVNITAPWCVTSKLMDEETYSDKTCIQLINELFVPILVESDKRPDINERYNMGGWPTTLFMSPEGLLIWGSTYVTGEEMRGLLQQLKLRFSQQKEKICKEAKEREEKIREININSTVGTTNLSLEIFRSTLNGILATYDPVFGGFGKAPKFQMQDSLRVMLHAEWETGGEDFSQVLTHTLEAITTKALWDPVDGGFFRYSMNDTWTAVQFEKLSDDNALTASLLLDAYSLIGVEKYRLIASQVIRFLFSFMFDESRSLFYSSLYANDKYYSARDRSKVDKPTVDRIVITTTNCVVSRLLLKAGVLIDPSYTQIALRNLEFFLSKDIVCHYYGSVPEPPSGLLKDELSLLELLIDAYEYVGNTTWLQRSQVLADRIMQIYWNEELGGLQDKIIQESDIGELRFPYKDMNENSRFAYSIAKLSYILGNESYMQKAKEILSNFPDYIGNYSHQTANYAIAAYFCLKPPVIIEANGPSELTTVCNSVYIPTKVIRHCQGFQHVTVFKDPSRSDTFTKPDSLREFLKQI